MAERRKTPTKDSQSARGWRDKPVEQEADKDIKEGGMGGSKREQETADKQ